MDKMCGKCGVAKPLTEFYFRQPTPRNKRGVYSSDCKLCIKTRRKSRYHGDDETRAKAIAYSKLWKRENPEATARSRAKPENKATKRNAQLARMYGITLSELEVRVGLQGNACAICGKSFGATIACVDHDHATGVIRGILCHRCNRGIGLLGDDPAILRAAVSYLTGFKEIGHA